jgi:catalase
MATDAERAVQAIDDIAGKVHEGYRTVHAKGVLLKGSFTATPEAAALSKAAHLQGPPVDVTVRFSNGGGHPFVRDGARDARGMATKFYLPDGSRTDIVAITLPSFFVRTPEDFIAFTRANKPFLFGAPGPKLPLFVATHRETWRALGAFARMKPPASYATRRYNGLHAYKWIAADGSERFVRYSWIPAAGEHDASGEATKDRDYLQKEIAERVEREPIRFTLQVQIAAAGDPTNDATAVWPDDRERVDVGTLELTALETGREQGDDVLVFDPTRVTDGIELSDDPLPLLRSQAYSISVERRSGAKRPAKLA